MSRRQLNYDFKQHQKYIERQRKREENGDFYKVKGYPKPLLPNVRYYIKNAGYTYVVIIKERFKDREELNYIYKAEVEEFVKPGEEDCYTWQAYWQSGFSFGSEGVDGLTKITHYSSKGCTIKRLTDSGYAKLFLVMNVK